MIIKRNELGFAALDYAASADVLKSRLDRFFGMEGRTEADGDSHCWIGYYSPTNVLLVKVGIYSSEDQYRVGWHVGSFYCGVSNDHGEDLTAVDKGLYDFDTRKAEPEWRV